MRPARIVIPATPAPGDFRQPRGTKPQPKPSRFTLGDGDTFDRAVTLGPIYIGAGLWALFIFGLIVRALKGAGMVP